MRKGVQTIRIYNGDARFEFLRWIDDHPLLQEIYDTMVTAAHQAGYRVVVVAEEEVPLR